MPNAAAPEDRERLNVNKERTARPGAGGVGTQRGAGETGCWETPQRTVQAPRPRGLALGCAHAACRCPSCPLPPSRLSGGLSGSAWGHRSGAEGPRSRQAAWPASFPADSGFRPRGSSRLGLRGARSPSAATAPGLSMEGARLPPPAAPPLSAETCGVRRVTGRGVLSSGLSHSHRRALEVLPTAGFPGSQPRPLPLQRLPQGRRPRGDLGRLAGSATPGGQCPHSPASRPAGAGCGRARPAPSGSTSWGLGTAAPDGADATAR